MNEKVSIIVPAYNAQGSIEKCINSLISQTHKNIEIIIVDDGSSDDTFQLCTKISCLDSRVKIIHQTNQGTSAAKNQGISFATGEYIAFVDSDDYVELTFVEQMLNSLKAEKCDQAICGFVSETVVGKFRFQSQFADGEISTQEAALNMFVPQDRSWGGYVWNKLYKASVIREKNIKFPCGYNMFEDVVFNLRYWRHCENAVSLNTPLYHYICNEQGLTKSRSNSEKWLKYCDAFDIALDECNVREVSNMLTVYKALHTATALRELACMGLCNHEKYKKMRKYLKDNIFKLVFCKQISLKKRLGAILTVGFPKFANKLKTNMEEICRH